MIAGKENIEKRDQRKEFDVIRTVLNVRSAAVQNIDDERIEGHLQKRMSVADIYR